MRNIQKEYEWQKNKYERIDCKIEKKLGISLKEKLREEGRSLASWVSENAENFLKKNEKKA